MDNNEKIQLDDISFDDVIGGDGVDTVAVEEEIAPPQEDEKQIETSDEEDVLDDVEETEEEYDEEEYDEDKSEEEEEDVEESELELSVVNEVLDKLGYDLEGDNYEDTADGLATMAEDVASKIADDRIDKIMDSFPLVKKHLEYVLAGGKSQNFMEAYDPNLDYNEVNIEEDDYRSQKAILGDYLELKGHDNDFIQSMLTDFEDTGKLYEKAEAAKNALAKHQGQQREQMIEKQRQQTDSQRRQLEDFWDNVEDRIEDAEDFAGIQITKRDKGEFFDYLSVPVTREGYTQRDLDHAEADMDIKLAIDYLMYTGFDLSSLIDSKAKTQTAKSLKERISRNEDRVKSTRRSTRRSKNVDLDNLDLSI